MAAGAPSADAVVVVDKVAERLDDGAGHPLKVSARLVAASPAVPRRGTPTADVISFPTKKNPSPSRTARGAK
jgi:hypothetical protein